MCVGKKYPLNNVPNYQELRLVERGFMLDADLNASRNIAYLGNSGMSGFSVSGPNATRVDAEGREAVETGLGYKPMNLSWVADISYHK